jgi:hypothetical protein
MKLPLNNTLEIESFDVQGVDFMRSFFTSYNNYFILVAVNNVSK